MTPCLKYCKIVCYNRGVICGCDKSTLVGGLMRTRIFVILGVLVGIGMVIFVIPMLPVAGRVTVATGGLIFWALVWHVAHLKKEQAELLNKTAKQKNEPEGELPGESEIARLESLRRIADRASQNDQGEERASEFVDIFRARVALEGVDPDPRLIFFAQK